MQGTLRALAKQLGLEDSVKFIKAVALDQMAQVIANADLGVVPKRADSFGNEAYSTKIMEFMSQGVPVVASRTKIDAFYFEEGVVHFFESGNSEAMAKAMLDVIENPDLRASLASRGYEYVRQHGWDQKKKEYLDLVDSLSTEIFADIPENDFQATLDSPSPIARSQTQPITASLLREVAAIPVEIEDVESEDVETEDGNTISTLETR
jgi:hypothetical protein